MNSRMAFLLIILLTGLFQNCGNGDAPMLTNPTFRQNTPEGRETANGTYYLVQNGYSCMTQMGTTATKNYSDRITIEDTHASFWGNYCNDAIAMADLPDPRISISSDNLTLTYQGNTYVYYEIEP